MQLCLIFLLCLLLANVTFSYGTTPKAIRLGGLFDKHTKHGRLSQKIFEFAISRVNKAQNDVQFVAVSESAEDAFDAVKKGCDIVKSSDGSGDGVAGLFLVTDQASSDMAGSLCEKLGIPVVHPLPELTYLHKKRNSKDLRRLMAMHLHPDIYTLSSALLHFVRGFHWQNIVVLYKGAEGLNRVKSVLNAGFLQFSVHEKVEMIFWPMKNTEKTLKDLRYNLPYRHIIVDIDTEEIADFLKAAHKMKMLTSYHHYMFTSLDLGAVSIAKEYTSGGVNITGYRLLDHTSKVAVDLLQELSDANVTFEGENLSVVLEAHHALTIDSVDMYTDAILKHLAVTQSLEAQPFNCTDSDGFWSAGPPLLSSLYHAVHDGLTGKINITNGKRVDFDLELIEYDNDGNVQVVGNWNLSHGLNITKSEDRRREEIQRDLNNKTLKVVVKVEEPFVMKEIYDGNKTRFYGFAIDMLEKIKENLNLKCRLFEVHDETTGRILSNGSWTGMIGTLINNKADLALGELTINYERSRVIDFTKPFMNMGISILFKRPKPDPPKLFSFLEPFHDGIWMCMIGAYAFVSIYLFAVARFSPYEWKNPHPCNPEFDTLENEFTVLNSFWFTMGSLMLQGSEVAPKASSTRIIAGVWSFFTLILISSYTANLAAFLTITRMSTPIQNADDLSKQTSIKYGCQYGGSTYRFFEADGHDSAKAKIPTYEKMWNFMSQNPDVFVNKSKMGIAKVRRGKYAYLMESTALRYQLSKNCDLMEVGGELDSKGYGIGLPKNSPYRDIISKEILKLSESQVLLQLYNNWWNLSNPKCDVRDDSLSATSAAQLGMDNLGGVFVFLVGGFALALIIAVLEFFVNAVVNSKTDRQALCAELAEECKFATNCCGPSRKPVRLLPIKIAKKLMFGYTDMQISQPRDSDNNFS